jgi:hypothetical protein
LAAVVKARTLLWAHPERLPTLGILDTKLDIILLRQNGFQHRVLDEKATEDTNLVDQVRASNPSDIECEGFRRALTSI